MRLAAADDLGRAPPRRRTRGSALFVDPSRPRLNEILPISDTSRGMLRHNRLEGEDSAASGNCSACRAARRLKSAPDLHCPAQTVGATSWHGVSARYWSAQCRDWRTISRNPHYGGIDLRALTVLDPFVGRGAVRSQGGPTGGQDRCRSFDPIACSITTFELMTASLPDLDDTLARFPEHCRQDISADITPPLQARLRVSRPSSLLRSRSLHLSVIQQALLTPTPTSYWLTSPGNPRSSAVPAAT